MSEWITDRRPTKLDANSYDMVLVQTTEGPLLVLHWDSVQAQTNGVHWMPVPLGGSWSSGWKNMWNDAGYNTNQRMI